MNCNELCLKEIIKKDKVIKYDYEFGEKWKDMLVESEKMYATYEVDISNVPDSVAVIPFLSNILPISWVFDLTIIVPELDKVFYDSIDDIKKGYIDMYPGLDFKGKLVVKKVVENKDEVNGSSVMFSGGVDAFSTLLNHLDENPDIITIFGADISLKDKTGIDIVNEKNKETADKLKINYYTIFSNFRECINPIFLSGYVAEKINCEWWHDFQHGIALIGLTTPLSYIKKYAKVYIASSFTYNDVGNYTCASDPTIDNHFKFSNIITIHDGFDYDRQAKVHNICEFVKKNNITLKLRVCWISTGGENCCCCEKCYRTIMGIIVERDDPKNYGLGLNKKTRAKMIKFLKKSLPYDTKNGNFFNYTPIQKKFNSNYTIEETPKDLMWFRTIKIGIKSMNFYYSMDMFIRKIKSFIKKKILKK